MSERRYTRDHEKYPQECELVEELAKELATDDSWAWAHEDDAKLAILKVADWLDKREWFTPAAVLREEAKK